MTITYARLFVKLITMLGYYRKENGSTMARKGFSGMSVKGK